MKDTMGLMSCVLGDRDPQRIAQSAVIDNGGSLPYKGGTLIVEASHLQYQEIRAKCYSQAGIKMGALKQCTDFKTGVTCEKSLDPTCKWRKQHLRKGIGKACMPAVEYDKWLEHYEKGAEEDRKRAEEQKKRIMPLETCPRAKKNCDNYEHCKVIDGKCQVDKTHPKYDACHKKRKKDCVDECQWFAPIQGKKIGCVNRKRAVDPKSVQTPSPSGSKKANERPHKNNGDKSNGKASLNSVAAKKYHPNLPTPEFPPDRRDVRKKFDKCVKEHSMFAYDKTGSRKDFNPTGTFLAPDEGLKGRLAKVRKLYRERSPKLAALMDAIKERDEHDLKTTGHLFKHVIYTDVKDSYFGVKLLTSIFLAEDFHIAKFSRPRSGGGQRKQKWSVVPPTLRGGAQTMQKSFMALSSGGMSGPAFFAKDSIGYAQNSALTTDDKNLIKDAAFKAFNKRSQLPDGSPGPNVYGQDVRFLLMDQGFKEGVDIFEAKYMWILEPPASQASLTQAVGRVMRLCGAQGMPYSEWKVYITVLANRLPTEDQKLMYRLTVDDEQKASAKTRLLFMKEGRNAAVDKLLMESMHTVAQHGAVTPKKLISKILQIP